MKLTDEEVEILNGRDGELMAKCLKTLVDYGDMFSAKRLVKTENPIHFVTSMGMTGLEECFKTLDELIKGGVKTKLPYTADPRPYDFENISYDEEEVESLKKLYKNQESYEKQIKDLGLKDDDSFSCTCYLDEVGNIPKRGDILSWAESSAVVFVNSVIGARSNRNSGLIEILGGICGKVPEFGFLLDENRKADYLIDIKTSKLPHPSLLGSAIGIKVMAKVPYIRGLDKYFKKLDDSCKDYLKDMGAASASNGAVGLYHVENLTPEAKDYGTDLLKKDYKTYTIDDEVLEKLYKSYPILWPSLDEKVHTVLMGCPHLSYTQLISICEKITNKLDKLGKDRVAPRTILSASPKVIKHFKDDKKELYDKSKKMGISIASQCPVMHMNASACGKKIVATNSNKLRTYTKARFFKDEDLLNIIVGEDYKNEI